MMQKRKLIIGAYDTATTWPWTLSELALTAPEQQTNYVQVPGRSGALDLSTAATDGIPAYNDRTLTATLETSEGNREERESAIKEMVNLLDGFRWKIVLPDSPDRYLDGRVSVGCNYSDLAHASVTITAVCYPYFLKMAETEVTASLTTSDTALTLACDRRSVVPTITVSAETVLTWGTSSYTISAGSRRIPGIRLTQGVHTLNARTTAGTGTIAVSYQEGSL